VLLKKEGGSLRLRLKAVEEGGSLRLQKEIAQLKERLTASLSDAKMQTAKAELLERKVTTLETKLEELEKKMSEEVPLRAEIAQLRDKVAESLPRVESEAKLRELSRKLTEEFQRQLQIANSVRRKEFETITDELESRIIDLETKSATRSIRESEGLDLSSGAPTPTRPLQSLRQQIATSRSCAKCNYENRVDAMFCASCGEALAPPVTSVRTDAQQLERDKRPVKCNHKNSADAIFCSICGQILDKKDETPIVEPDNPQKVSRIKSLLQSRRKRQREEKRQREADEEAKHAPRG
jgi:hypothetical protein